MLLFCGNSYTQRVSRSDKKKQKQKKTKQKIYMYIYIYLYIYKEFSPCLCIYIYIYIYIYNSCCVFFWYISNVSLISCLILATSAGIKPTHKYPYLLHVRVWIKCAQMQTISKRTLDFQNYSLICFLVRRFLSIRASFEKAWDCHGLCAKKVSKSTNAY